MSEKKQRLSSKDWEALLKIMRYWPKPYRDDIAKLVWHCSWLDAKVVRLENENRELRQKTMFESIKENETKITTGVVPSPPKEQWPLKKRLAAMLDDGLKGSPQWLSTLKWNDLSDDEALALAFQCDQSPVDK